jgi:hypothetical protein
VTQPFLVVQSRVYAVLAQRKEDGWWVWREGHAPMEWSEERFEEVFDLETRRECTDLGALCLNGKPKPKVKRDRRKPKAG